MKMSDVFTLVSVFLTFFGVLVLAYGIGLYFDQVQIALILGFGLAILIVAFYFFRKGKLLRNDEYLVQLQNIENNKK